MKVGLPCKVCAASAWFAVSVLPSFRCFLAAFSGGMQASGLLEWWLLCHSVRLKSQGDSLHCQVDEFDEVY